MRKPGSQAVPGFFRASRIRRGTALLLLALFPLLSRALGPHELAVIFNDADIDSRLMALSYARQAGVPACNLIGVEVPPGADGQVPEAVTVDDFRTRIYEPVQAALTEAGLSRQILAWAYSCSFPARVTAASNTLAKAGRADLSLTGATFLRGVWPEQPAQIVSAQYRSPLFRCPLASDADGVAEARSLDQMRAEILSGMPLPAMMLAYTGPRGQSLQGALTALSRAIGATSTAPTGAIWFAKTDDVRYWCRSSAVARAAAFIDARAPATGVRAVVSTNQPAAGNGPVVGYMAGTRSVNLAPGILAPGAYADHLTSFGAAFWTGAQMKATKWLERGAAATSGTVVEPYANASKFASPWIFSLLLGGATQLEALYGAIRSPLQILPLGDPLCAPWAPRLEPRIEGLPDSGEAPAAQRLALRAAYTAPPSGDAAAPAEGPRFTWLVDGRPAATGPRLTLSGLPAGEHAIRLIVRQRIGSLRCQGFTEQTITLR